jgi:anti-anti-sigma regulatory factor
MATITVQRNDDQDLNSALERAKEKLHSAEGELVLDFSGVGRVDWNALQAMEAFARKAEEKAVKVVLRGVNVDVYKVLKLVRLTSRFSFLS